MTDRPPTDPLGPGGPGPGDSRLFGGALDHDFESTGVRALAVLAEDRSRGAAEIADAILEWMERWDGADAVRPADVAAALARIGRAQTAMAPALRVANALLLEIERREGAEPEVVRRAVARTADDWRRRRAAAAEAVALHLRRAFEGVPVVYTYSGSSTVADAIVAHHAAGAWFRVVLSEARPGGEGVTLARRLARLGIPVRLGTEAWMWEAFDDPGVFAVGADALTSKVWINKIGTRALARRAREAGAQVVVAADTSKWLPPALAALPRSYSRAPEEIVPDPPDGLEVVNPYFEEIGYDALDRLVTERGPTRPKDLRGSEIPVARALR